MIKHLFIFTSTVIVLLLSANVYSETNNKAYDGYTLFSSLFGNTTYLINMEGQIVHSWDMDSSAAFSTYFLENGNLLRSASMGGGMGFGGMGAFGRGMRGNNPGTAQDQNTPQRPGGIGAGGKIQEIDWDGNIVWEYEYATDTQVPHHDIEKMPNGHILLICWDGKTAEESIADGRNPEYQTGSLNPDSIIEIKAVADNKWEVVWEWNVWDHLVQDFDPDKPNYGNVSQHPELIDINYSESWADEPAEGGGQGNRRGGGFGGMGGGMMGGGGRIPIADWTHLNAIDYNEALDLIIVSSYTFSEIWIIDHSTTKEEAAGHSGGKYGKGGDLLYRWGNPAAYKQGTNDDQTLFCPHDIQWIAKGLPGEGNMLIFNNGPNRQNGRYSSVEEFILPVNDNGQFKMNGQIFAEVKSVWQYIDPNDKTNFYGMNISGAQRLPNGNTLICEGPKGHLFEVTPDKEIVWEYQYSSPSGGGGRMGAGGMGGFMAGQGGFGMRGQNAVADVNSVALPADQGAPGNPGRRGFGGNGIAAAPGARRGGGGMGLGGMGGGFASQIFRATRIPSDHPALVSKDLKPESEN